MEIECAWLPNYNANFAYSNPNFEMCAAGTNLCQWNWIGHLCLHSVQPLKMLPIIYHTSYDVFAFLW